MEKGTKTDWSRLTPCDLTTTLAYENAKKMFPSKNEDLWKDVAALALIESTFTEGFECNIIDLVDAIRTAYKIDRPLFSSKSLRYHTFISVNRDTIEFTTQPWLKEVAGKPIENHIFENQDKVAPRIREAFKEAYGKDIIFWPQMDSDVFKNACITNAQNKTFVVDTRCFNTKSDLHRYIHLKFFAKEMGLDVGFVRNHQPSSNFDDQDFKVFVYEGV